MMDNLKHTLSPPPPVQPRVVRLEPADNVAIAIDLLNQGDSALGVTIRERILRGHKFAVQPVAVGQPIVKFGQPIGIAQQNILPGDWVHEHNLGFAAVAGEYEFAPDRPPEDLLPLEQRSTFEGYRRAGGRTGTRNYIGILTSVNCSASVARFAADAVKRSGMLADFPEVDDVIAIVHGTGCGHAAHGEGFDVLRRTQWGYASHPNFAGVIMVGLGCEVFQIGRMKEECGLKESDMFRTLTIQETGGTRRTVDAIVEAVRAMLPVVAASKRETRPASELVLGLQCGGSDGYSGLTANPALGVASDIVVHNGGTSILSETPEIYGAEHLLIQRAASRAVAERLIARIQWWERYTYSSGGEMNNNPSPGNKAGGLTTILEKSLGAAAKAGRSSLRAVYEYAERVREPGFVFMDTPGYDPVSATGQIAGGANLICFTTGRGSAFGCKPVPSLKLATNSDIYGRMVDDMDIDCGDVLDGTSLAAKGQEIFEAMLNMASGARTKSEILGYGDHEFVPWQIGAVM